jgi:hypothetical protein
MLKLKIYLNSRNLSREFGTFKTFFKFSQLLFSQKPEQEHDENSFYRYFEKCRKMAGKLMYLPQTLKRDPKSPPTHTLNLKQTKATHKKKKKKKKKNEILKKPNNNKIKCRAASRPPM